MLNRSRMVFGMARFPVKIRSRVVHIPNESFDTDCISHLQHAMYITPKMRKNQQKIYGRRSIMRNRRRTVFRIVAFPIKIRSRVVHRPSELFNTNCISHLQQAM